MIESTFTSYRDIATEKAHLIPLLGGSLASSPSLLTDDRLSPKAFVSRISPIPILFIHGTKDRVVPISHGQQLAELAGEPKAFLVIRNGRHLEAFSKFLPQTRPLVLDFFEKAVTGRDF